MLHTKLTRLEVNHYDFDTPSNVTLELTSNYADAWMAYFNDRMNETGSSLKWDPDKAESDYYLWSEPYSADARTVYLKFNKIERLSCTIAVITVIID